jgi:hypothetical protein
MWEALVQKAPYVAALVFVVIMFLRHQAKESARRDEFDLARMMELERIGQTCHDHTKELNDRAVAAIDNSSRVIEDNTKIIGAIERRMNGG